MGNGESIWTIEKNNVQNTRFSSVIFADENF